MMWSVEYCTDGDSPTAKAKVRTDTALRLWVHEVDRERGVRGSIFDQDSYDSPTGNRRQWGTDYWWLRMTREASKMRVSKNPNPEVFTEHISFPWDLTCPEHGVVDSFFTHSAAMNEAAYHAKFAHPRKESA